MARRKKSEEAVADSLEGTVEGLARDHFEKEKAAYEAATGEKVTYEPPMPTTRTPLSETRRWGTNAETAEAEESSDQADDIKDFQGETSAE